MLVCLIHTCKYCLSVCIVFNLSGLFSTNILNSQYIVTQPRNHYMHLDYGIHCLIKDEVCVINLIRNLGRGQFKIILYER